MDTFDAIEQRRSIKHFDRDHEMSTEEVNKLFSLAMLTPTSFNIQNWRFVYITDKAKRQTIQDAAWGQAQVTEASMLILVLGACIAIICRGIRNGRKTSGT